MHLGLLLGDLDEAAQRIQEPHFARRKRSTG
jgi:hypothetical protein